MLAPIIALKKIFEIPVPIPHIPFTLVTHTLLITGTNWR
jgi:hypothetical protein